MYHRELGKSTLDIWGEEQDAKRARTVELTRFATALVTLERQSLFEAIASDNFEQVTEYLKPYMYQQLEAHDFGSYCHEGRNLLEDALKQLTYLDTSAFSPELCAVLYYEASNIAYELEGSLCDFCSYDTDEFEGDADDDALNEAAETKSTKSGLYLEWSFPLADHPLADQLRRAVQDSLYIENAEPTVSDFSDEAVIYTRSDWSAIGDRLYDLGVTLSPEEMDALIDFASDYASMVDDEDDTAELDAIRKEGDK